MDLVGKHMNTPVLDKFVKSWINLFSHSPKSRLQWRTQTGLSIPSYSVTRWWSKFEVMHQMFKAFGDVQSFLESSELPPTTSGKLLAIISDAAKFRKLQMELAVTIDAMEEFVKATYQLEGDGVLVVTTYEQLRVLYSVISSQHYPNVDAVAEKLSKGNIVHKQMLKSYARDCVEPAFEYFKQKFDMELKPLVEVFKAARYFSPSKVAELKPSAQDIDELSTFPFLKSAVVANLKSELPMYMAAAKDVSASVDVTSWWKSNEDKLPHWAKAFSIIALV